MSLMAGRTHLATVATLFWVVTTGVAALTVALVLATLTAPVPDQFGVRGFNPVAAITFASVGMVIIRRLPAQPMGWLFLVIGLCVAVNGALIEIATAAPIAMPGLAIPAIVAWPIAWIWVPQVALALVFLPLLFPTGRLPSPRWRWVAVFATAGTIGGTIMAAVVPGPVETGVPIDNPVAAPIDLETYDTLFAIGLIPLVVAGLLAVGSLWFRFRGATPELRQQIKWLLFACGFAAGAFVLVAVTTAIQVEPPIAKIAEVLLLVGVLGIAVAAGLAILRYRLYEIDRIVSRTLGWTIATVAVVAIYLTAVLMLQGALGGLTQGDTLAVAASTLLAAAAFQPLRTRVQRLADRRFNRTRYDAERTVAAFADRLRDQVELQAVASQLDEAVRQTVAPAATAVWLRARNDFRTKEA